MKLFRNMFRDYKDCIPVDDEDSLTPSLSLHLDQPHNLPQQQQPQGVHKVVDSLNTKEVDVRKSMLADSDKLSLEKDSSENICGSFLLGDLPPLGSSASLGYFYFVIDMIAEFKFQICI